jgi:HNH endonuclease
MDDFQSLSDDQLLAAIERFADEERERIPWFLACLGEADRRGVFIKRGYSSTFDYCLRKLKFSEGEAFRRIQAARAGVSRPGILSALSEGHLTLTSVSKIAPHVHRADAPEIIARAEGKSTRELDELLVPLRPEAGKPDRMRAVSIIAPIANGGDPPAAITRVDFSFQGPPALREAIERAKDMLSHKFPFGGMGEVLFEIVQEYLERHDPQQTLKLGRLAPPKGRSSIPAAIRRAVWARDGGRCAFIGPDATRCQTRRALELDHKTPRALGGTDTLENLRLLCRPHNDSERRRILGEGELSTQLARASLVDN